ncbi:MAG: calcium/sodium antiporter [Gaiella sp.]|nr:calcium/sodium antiporter [Gaiella sp.]
MLDDLPILLLGLACAGGGGELFVRGAVGIAESARVPPGIVGATVAAFATSSPELAVAISSGLSGRSELALGDALGSNVVNVGLVLGLALLVGPMRVAGGVVRRDIAAALAIPIATVALVADGRLSRLDAVVLLVLFAVWLAASLDEARRERSAAGEVLGEHSPVRAALAGAAGLVLLVAAGRLIVSGASSIGADLGLDTFVIGVVLVAVGTSVPELATTVVARLRGHDEVGLGTILGSNVFNGALIVPVAALLSPVPIDRDEVATSLGFGIALVVCVLPLGGMLGRGRGALLVCGYAASVAALLLMHA